MGVKLTRGVHPKTCTHIDSMSSSEPIPKRYNHGQLCVARGHAYEVRCAEILRNTIICGETPAVLKTAGSEEGPDIPIDLPSFGRICFEAKDKGAFEGGTKKLIYHDGALRILDDCIHKTILGDTVLFGGRNIPWYEGKRTMEDWDAVRDIFKDAYIQAADDSIAEYYKLKGAHYIQVEGRGLFHTGSDPLGLDVPYFKCTVIMRIRASKHKKKGIPTDITAGLQFDRKTLPKSPYSLDGPLPPVMKPASQPPPQVESEPQTTS